MRTDVVVVIPPTLDEHLRLRQRVENLAIKELVAQLSVERFHIAIQSVLRGPCMSSLGRKLGRGVFAAAVRAVRSGATATSQHP